MRFVMVQPWMWSGLLRFGESESIRCTRQYGWEFWITWKGDIDTYVHCDSRMIYRETNSKCLIHPRRFLKLTCGSATLKRSATKWCRNWMVKIMKDFWEWCSAFYWLSRFLSGIHNREPFRPELPGPDFIGLMMPQDIAQASTAAMVLSVNGTKKAKRVLENIYVIFGMWVTKW